jgi:hypothetical protein
MAATFCAARSTSGSDSLLLECIARAVAIDPGRMERIRGRKLERERIARETAERRERQQYIPLNSRIVSLHQRVDASVPHLVAEAFKALHENEQLRFEEAAGDELVEGLPIYLTLTPEERRRGLVACRTIHPFTVALRACKPRLEDH